MTAFSDNSSFSTDLFSDNRYVELTSVFDPAQVRLRDLTGTERVGEPFSYQIRMISRDPIEDLARVVGTRMAVGLKLKDGSDRYFEGIVTGFRFVGIDETRRTNYVAEVRSGCSRIKRRWRSSRRCSRTIPQPVSGTPRAARECASARFAYSGTRRTSPSSAG
jgi:uncharacterized protein involved in type VI secretion and phage assembly